MIKNNRDFEAKQHVGSAKQTQISKEYRLYLAEVYQSELDLHM